MPATVTLSVVSHRQNALANQLLDDVARHCAGRVAAVITLNAHDDVQLSAPPAAVPMEVVVNAQPRGFAANHNAAFARCRTPFFCIANPDIRLPADPFPPLIRSVADDRVGVAGPLVRNPAGGVEDSARRFPTPSILLRKLLSDRPAPDYPVDQGPVEVDWIAGMFMFFRSETFRALGGFDEAYFLYYEDVDLCRRLHREARTVIYDPACEVVHDARRASRRNPLFAHHHVASLFRYFLG